MNQEHPKSHSVACGDISLHVFEWGAALRGRAPTILMLHATGFHGRCFDEVIRRLGDRHVLSVDQRGHGRSAAPPITDWLDFGRDIEAVIDAFSLAGALGVGHSMGGHALVLAAAARPSAFERLILLDPVIFEPAVYEGETSAQASGLSLLPEGAVHPTAKRRDRFASAQAMIDRFSDRPPYAAFDEACLRDYCVYGLLPDPESEGLRLACRPAFEASVYMSSRHNAFVHEAVPRIEVPVEIVRARRPPPGRDIMDFSSSPTWPGLVDAFPNAREQFLAERTHFFPLEDPALVAERILA